MSAPATVAALRQLLAGRFPAAALPDPASGGSREGRALATGIPAIDGVTGGLPLGALTEIVCAAPSCGGQLLLGQLLAATRLAHRRVALVDSSDSFDPASFPADLLAHLIWVRGSGPTTAPFSDPVAAGERSDHVVTCPATRSLRSSAATPAVAVVPRGDFPGIGPAPAGSRTKPPAAATAWALQAADLLVRDANLGLVVLDLRRASAADLDRTPATHWHRLRHAAATADLPLVVQTPCAVVPSARIRFLLASSHAFPALTLDRAPLLAAFAPLLQRHRLAAAV